MGFTQSSEYINGIWHVGVTNTLAAIGGIPRLRAEILALSRGEKVDNPILGSFEKGRAEFGTDPYKIVFPFDNGTLEYQNYGKDSLTFADRALRGATHLQGKLSFWRAVHSAQQRGFAEQIVHRAAQYLRDGKDSIALSDMGIDPVLAGKLRQDLGTAFVFDGDKLVSVDVTKIRDTKAAEEFVQSVHRGVSQIIQGTFIGETNKWVHDGLMRFVTQFRNFSITSVEKQWARQSGNRGIPAAAGIMIGSMSLAAPIYIARTVLASMGRKDQEEYLDKQLTVAQIARASMNYVALTGLAGDFLDLTTAVTGIGKVTGGRSAASSEFVGNAVAPAIGLVNDVWNGLQNNKEGTDPHELIKALPFSRLPWLLPLLNATN